METLRYTMELEEEFNQLVIDEELKNEIDRFMEMNYKDIHLSKSRYHRLYYRASLQNIIENINNPNLLNEMKNLNTESIKRIQKNPTVPI